MKPLPPKRPLQFLRWFCREDYLEEIEGDVTEVFIKRVKTLGARKARLLFLLDVIKLFRPEIIGFRKNRTHFNYYDMLRNNFKIAFRNLWKNKFSSAINIFGLTTGIASCLFIILFIQNELSYDKFQPNGNRIARVIMEYSFEGGTETTKGNFTSTKVAPVFSRTFPEVIKAVRMSDPDVIVKSDDYLTTEKFFLYADSTFFDAFYHEVVSGDIRSALNGPGKLVLTETTAHKYFGNENPVGKTLYLGSDAKPFDVTAVIRDYPETSQLKFNMIGSFSSMGQNDVTSYFNANYTTYLLLNDESSFSALQEKIHTFMKEDAKADNAKITFYLEPFNEIHLHSPYSAIVPNTSITYLYILSAVAALILIIVCITYVNLSTAKSVERAREVGIRKVSGAAQFQLFWQFIGESFVLFGLSVIFSFAIATLLLPYFNILVGKELSLSSIFGSSFLIIVIGIILVVSLFAGAYPALILAGLQPAKVLKGVFKNTSSARWLQQSLIVFQFAISVFLIAATLIIGRQLTFIQNQKLGYDRDKVVRLSIDWGTPYEKSELLKQQFQTLPGVTVVSRCSTSPVRISSGYTMSKNTSKDDEQISVKACRVDENYIKTTGLELIAGENFTEQDMKEASVENWEDQTYHFILNESAAQRLGWTPEEAIGQQLHLNRPGIVRGVVKDFHFQSMHERIVPVVLFTSSWGGTLLVKISGSDIQQTIKELESRWKQLLPNRPFEFQFINDDYNRMYQSELQLGQVMTLFSGIAIILATLGLFGLSSYMIQQRTKEIAIRKVMGAPLLNLLSILSGGFVGLVLIAIVLASPIAYYLMSRWLNDFVYRVDLSLWIFIFSGACAISIALLTISIQGWKTSKANPVTSLRSE